MTGHSDEIKCLSCPAARKKKKAVDHQTDAVELREFMDHTTSTEEVVCQFHFVCVYYLHQGRCRLCDTQHLFVGLSPGLHKMLQADLAEIFTEGPA